MKSILVIGLGRFGRHMVAKLLEEGNSVLAIEKNEERADNALDIISDVQIADATNEMVIRSLGVSNSVLSQSKTTFRAHWRSPCC